MCRPRGLVVIEDLHWADPETIGVVEYLADNVAGTPIVLLATMRDEETRPAASLARALQARDSATVLRLLRLDRSETARLAAGCLGIDSDDLPAQLIAHLDASADGLPLLVEDLVGAAVADGSLLLGIGGWEMVRPPTPRVTLTFADTVRSRPGQLSPAARSVVSAAAVFGRAIPWDLLAAVAGLDGAGVLEGLRHAVDAALVVVEEPGFAFRHALTADAVLDALLPPERARLSHLAANAVEAAHPALEGEWGVVAADLRAGAGQRGDAARLLLRTGTDALAGGAVTGAALLLERAVALADEPLLARACTLALLEAVATAGDARHAEVMAAALLPLITGEPEAVTAHLLLARATWAPARTMRPTSSPPPAPPPAATTWPRRESTPSPPSRPWTRPADRAEVAEGLARRAVAVAEAAGLHEVACGALEVIGRCARVRDLDAAEAAFARELQLAKAGGLGLWRLRALSELGTIAWLRRADPSGVQAAHDAAVEAGALLLAAGYAINLAVFHNFLGDYDRSATIARECEATADRLGATGLVSAAVVCQAMGAAHQGRRDDTEELLARAGPLVGGDVEVVVWGLCRSLLALVEEDRPRAEDAFARADRAMRRLPALMGDVFSGFWLILRLVEGRAGAADLVDIERHAPGTVLHTLTGAVARAIVAGRAGLSSVAESELREARAAARGPLAWNLCLRLAAEAALADGWGDPPTWLLEVEAWSVVSGLPRMTGACRDLLRRAGVTVARRGSDALSADLRRAGVTAREADVLRLVGGHLTNREIAERLDLSPRTVEKHVASLMAKLGAASRRELGTRIGANT